MAKIVLEKEITKRKNLFEAKTIVEKIYAESVDKRLIVFDRFYPAIEFLNKFPEPLFIVFPKEDDSWIIKCVRDGRLTYINRKDLPESWAGKSGEGLEKITGVSGATFCHDGRFLAAAKTKEAILKLAEIAPNS